MHCLSGRGVSLNYIFTHHLEMVNSLSHANTKYGNLACEVPDGIAADAGISLGMAWARTDNELGRIFVDQLVEGDLVIPEDGYRGPFED